MNCVAPGHISTGITNYDLGPVIQLSQPLQRQGTGADVADAVLFLASDRSAQITGTVVPVDGGTVGGALVRPDAIARGPGQGRRRWRCRLNSSFEVGRWSTEPGTPGRRADVAITGGRIVSPRR